MAKKNTYIERIKQIVAEEKYDYRDIVEDIIPIFITFFEIQKDDRYQPNVLHKLSDILCLAFFAIIGGENTWVGIEEFCKYHEDELRTYLELKNGIPSHDTFRRVFNIVKIDEFGELANMAIKPIIQKAVDNHIGEFIVDEKNYIDDIISFDGKTSNGSNKRSRDGTFVKSLNTLHVYSTEFGLTLASLPIEDKTNEIPVGQAFFSKLNLSGKVVTCDALNTQKELTKIIFRNHGNYVLPIKENQKELKEQIELYFEDPDKRYLLEEKEIDKEASKIVTRKYYLTSEVFWCKDIEKWSNVQGFGRVNRKVENLLTGEVTSEDTFYITSFNDSVKLFAKTVRNHWSTENMHRDLDMFFDDDGNNTTRSNALLNLNTLKKGVNSILKLVQGFYGANYSKQNIRKRIAWGFKTEIDNMFKSIAYLVKNKRK